MGAKSSTVTLFKEHINTLKNSLNISNEDIQYVYEVLGVVNTDNIKWSVVNKKIENFKIAVMEINQYTNKLAQLLTIRELEAKKVINKSIGKMLIKVLEINANQQISDSDLVELAKIPKYREFAIKTLKIDKSVIDLNLIKLNTLISNFGNLDIYIGHLDALLKDEDIRYIHMYKVKSLKDSSNLRHEVSRARAYELNIGKHEGFKVVFNRFGDPSGESLQMNINREAQRLIHDINWNAIAIALD